VWDIFPRLFSPVPFSSVAVEAPLSDILVFPIGFFFYHPSLSPGRTRFSRSSFRLLFPLPFRYSRHSIDGAAPSSTPILAVSFSLPIRFGFRLFSTTSFLLEGASRTSPIFSSLLRSASTTHRSRCFGWIGTFGGPPFFDLLIRYLLANLTQSPSATTIFISFCRGVCAQSGNFSSLHLLFRL